MQLTSFLLFAPLSKCVSLKRRQLLWLAHRYNDCILHLQSPYGVSKYYIIYCQLALPAFKLLSGTNTSILSIPKEVKKWFSTIAQTRGQTWDILVLVYFLSQQQRIRPLGYCAPLPHVPKEVFDVVS